MSWLEDLKAEMRKLSPVGLNFLIVVVIASLAYTLGAQCSRTVLFSQAGLLMGLIIGPFFAPAVARWPNSEDSVVQREDLALYLEGKMKRYSLLFSVNGGAFAIAKFSGEGHDIGGFSITSLSVGAALFTVIMTADIWLWGAAMRERHGRRLFGPVGQTILLMIGALLFSGWILVGLVKVPALAISNHADAAHNVAGQAIR